MNVFSKTKNLLIINDANKKLWKRLANFIIGCFFVALSYNTFVAPNSLIPGGVGGIAIILNRLFHLSYSTVILILNLILLVISYIVLGKEKTKATILGSLLFPLFVKLTSNIFIWIPLENSPLLLSAVFGGMLFGLGAGLVFKAGFTLGGTDIINQIISKYAKTSIGKSMLLSDGLIVLSSGYFFGLNHMMYSIILLYIISLISDRIILGISDSKIFFIITDKEEEVKEFILKELNHGVTVFKAQGGYKRTNENVLMTVLPTKEYYRLKEGISQIDEEAFYIINDTYEVFGGE